MKKLLLGSVLIVVVLAGCTVFVPPLAWEGGAPKAPTPAGRDVAPAGTMR